MSSKRVVFHSSSQQGLSQISPKISTHGQNWVYATKDPVMSMVFLDNGSDDFVLGISRDPKTKLPTLVERFKGAIDVAYKGAKGSLYTLAGENFQEGQTSWTEEVVSATPAEVLEEEVIDDAYQMIQQLAEQGKLQIMYYPQRLPHIPEDDSDLVAKAVRWYKSGISPNLTNLKKYHPQLVSKVEELIKI